MKDKPHEIIYTNNGEIYSSLTQFDISKLYIVDHSEYYALPFVRGDGKRYKFTDQFTQLYDGTPSDLDMTGFDLCPDVTLWVSVGSIDIAQKDDFDLFFAIDSTDQLHRIAGYYNLPYPISNDIGDKIDNAPAEISLFNVNGRSIVSGGVKFVNGIPTSLKVYTYPKLFGEYEVWMYGISYYDHGKPWESGAVYQKLTGGISIHNSQMVNRGNNMREQRIITDREDGKRLQYFFMRGVDPILKWEGRVLDNNNTVVDIKRYKSSKFFLNAMSGMTNGDSLGEYDLCPDVRIWLGRSWFDNNDEEELIFCITGGSDQLRKISNYYSLPYPCNDEMTNVLDTNQILYRATHYDLYKRGPGRYVPIIVGSVVLINKIPSKLLFYTFLRQWEFEEHIEIPKFG